MGGTAPSKPQRKVVNDAKYRQIAKNAVNQRAVYLKSIDESIKGDPSVTNIVKQMAALLKMEGNQVGVVNQFVDAMGKQWQAIMAQENKLIQAIGEDEIADLKNIRSEYFVLLLKTKNALVGSIEESKIQRENVANLIKILDNATDSGYTHEGTVGFDEGMSTLQQWINPEELEQIVEKWSILCNKLDQKRTKMQKMYEKYKSQGWWTKFFIGLGVVVAIGVTVALIVATSGAAAVIAAGAKTTTVLGCKMVSTHFAAAMVGFGAAAVVAGSAGLYAYCYEPGEMAKQARQISNLLKDILKNAHGIRGKVSEMQDGKKSIKSRYNFLKNKKLVRNMKQDLLAIDNYLFSYHQKGDEAVLAIKRAYRAFIDQ